MATGSDQTLGLGSLRLSTPKEFSGKSEDWDDFSFVMRSYMSTFDIRFGVLMKNAEKADVPITDAMLDDYDKKLTDLPDNQSTALARQLYFILISVVGPARNTIRMVPDENGFEA